jgi:hypothetical protein
MPQLFKPLSAVIAEVEKIVLAFFNRLESGERIKG